MNQENDAPAAPKAKSDYRIKLLFLAVVLAAVVVIYLKQRQSPQLEGWSLDPNSTLASAARENRPVAMFFLSDPPNEATTRMIKDSLSLSMVKRELTEDQYLPVVVKVGRDGKSPLAQKYNVTEFPALLAISPEGIVLDRRSGAYVGADEVSRMLKRALKKP